MTHPSLSPQAQQQAAALVADVEARAEKHFTPSGDGSMVWRRWPCKRAEGGTPVILLHGGAGSWSHWIRNVDALAERHEVWAMDTPGLGDSAIPEPLSMEGLCDTVHRGADQLIPSEPVNVMGFSFGGPIATTLAVHLGGRLRNLVLVASRFVRGYSRVHPDLINWKKLSDPAERLAAHRTNLSRLMMGHEEHIDALAVYVQSVNAAKGRVRGTKLNLGTRLLDYLPRVRAQGRITGISGRDDQGAEGIIEQQDAALKAVQPTGLVHVLDNAGHWVQYEAAERFNRLALEALAQ